MVPTYDNGGGRCGNCTMTCSGSACSGGSYNQTFRNSYVEPYYYQIDDSPTQKMIFREFLSRLFPENFKVMEKAKDLRLSVKRYFRRMLFCRSGYLPNRVRRIRCSA